MTNTSVDTDATGTDAQWRRWGELEPYFGVITNEKFRRRNLDEQALHEFFESGRVHVEGVLRICRKRLGKDFHPRRVLDFGCGVGRLLVPFAAHAEQVVGVDVSEAMLAEARRNCELRGIGNVQLLPSDDQLSQVDGGFDLVHSAIVLQHIDPRRGRAIFKRLLELVRPGGAGAIQLTYAKAMFPDTYGQPPVAEPAPPAPVADGAPRSGWRLPIPSRPAEPAAPPPAPPADPEMQMNPYSLNELFFLVQQSGVRQVQVNFTDHGGELGVFLYFHRPAKARGAA